MTRLKRQSINEILLFGSFKHAMIGHYLKKGPVAVKSFLLAKLFDSLRLSSTLFAILALAVSWSSVALSQACPADYQFNMTHTPDPAHPLTIEKFGICAVITTAPGSPNYMIPLNTGGSIAPYEFNLFLAHLPPGISSAACTSPTYQTSGWGACVPNIVNGCGLGSGTQTRTASCQQQTCVNDQTQTQAALDTVCVNANLQTPATSQLCDIACPQVIGICATPPNGGTFATAPAGNTLCSSGSPSPASLPASPPWNWSCTGSNSGGDQTGCAATQTAAPTCTLGSLIISPEGDHAACMANKNAIGPHPCNPSWNTGDTLAMSNFDVVGRCYDTNSCASGGTIFSYRQCINVICPSGTTLSSASGVAASPAGCYCPNATDTWDGSSCVGAAACTGGGILPVACCTAPAPSNSHGARALCCGMKDGPPPLYPSTPTLPAWSTPPDAVGSALGINNPLNNVPSGGWSSGTHCGCGFSSGNSGSGVFMLDWWSGAVHGC